MGNGCFVGRQRDGRAFKLSPIVPGHLPAGIVWTMPEEFPLFKACFGLSRKAENEVEKIREINQSESSFGQFRNKFRSRKEKLQRSRIAKRTAKQTVATRKSRRR